MAAAEPTGRELLVLWTLAHGLGYRGAAKALGMTEKGVQSSRDRSTKRLGARGTEHAIAICFRRGLFPLGARTVLTEEERRRLRWLR